MLTYADVLTYADRGGDLLALYVQVQCVLCLALGIRTQVFVLLH
jgi:hypothetical protein